MNDKEDPLAPPGDNRLLEAFLHYFGISAQAPKHLLLAEMARCFARLPYENLTKIIRDAECGDTRIVRRTPLEVVHEHFSHGTGGTCFSLTAALLYLVRSLGFDADPILADRPYGANTHCALKVSIEGRPYLLDPGYLIVEPIPLEGLSETVIRTDFNHVALTRDVDGGRVDLATVNSGARTHRLTFRLEPAEHGDFLETWGQSFRWDMMAYPLLTRVSGGQQIYLQGNRLQKRDHESVKREEISPHAVADRIRTEFGIDPIIAQRALKILRDRGERYG